MSTIVHYPVKVTEYHVSVEKRSAEIELEGVEAALPGIERLDTELKEVGWITFSDAAADGRDTFDRAGRLHMSRPLALFAGVLDMLRNDEPVFLREDGTLSTYLEPGR
jgi:hypothetical protein